MKFIDEATITVSSGKGGAGCVSFRREAKLPRGGPDGGDGGNGGNVVFRANPRLGSLLDLKLKKSYSAKDGFPGAGQNKTGASGEDLILSVPVGTVIKSEDGRLLIDLNTAEDFVFLKGGRGGKGNTFYKSSVHQAPEIAQKGEAGQTKTVHLELKLLADVGIIGQPNAGKSTLISRISAAKPKIADYPFTTLVPNLGVVKVDAERSFVVADIPGLIKGAHKGVGLGSQFLRHIERTRLFVHVVDVFNKTPEDAFAAFEEINAELENHDSLHKGSEGYSPLATREQYVVINKVDATLDDEVAAHVQYFAQKGIDVVPLSAASGTNIKKLIYDLGERVFVDEQQ